MHRSPFVLCVCDHGGCCVDGTNCQNLPVLLSCMHASSTFTTALPGGCDQFQADRDPWKPSIITLTWKPSIITLTCRLSLESATVGTCSQWTHVHNGRSIAHNINKIRLISTNIFFYVFSLVHKNWAIFIDHSTADRWRKLDELQWLTLLSLIVASASKPTTYVAATPRRPYVQSPLSPPETRPLPCPSHLFNASLVLSPDKVSIIKPFTNFILLS